MVWLPIDTFPKDGSYVLIRYVKKTRVRSFQKYQEITMVSEATYTLINYKQKWAWFDRCERLICEEDSKLVKVTHWMPLPPEP